jgi:hypothetical protein
MARIAKADQGYAGGGGDRKLKHRDIDPVIQLKKEAIRTRVVLRRFR